jgi:hypothetical protein
VGAWRWRWRYKNLHIHHFLLNAFLAFLSFAKDPLFKHDGCQATVVALEGSGAAFSCSLQYDNGETHAGVRPSCISRIATPEETVWTGAPPLCGEKVLRKITSADVCHRFVKIKTGQSRESYANHKARTLPAAGEPNCFHLSTVPLYFR